MGGNKIGSFINNMTFEAELNVNGRTVNEPFVKKNPCKEGEVFESGRTCYQIGETCDTSARLLAENEEGGESKH